MSVRFFTIEVLEKELLLPKSYGTATVEIGDITVFPRTDWYPLVSSTSKGGDKGQNAPYGRQDREIKVTVTGIFTGTAGNVAVPRVTPVAEDESARLSWVPERLSTKDLLSQGTRTINFDFFSSQALVTKQRSKPKLVEPKEPKPHAFDPTQESRKRSASESVQKENQKPFVLKTRDDLNLERLVVTSFMGGVRATGPLSPKVATPKVATPSKKELDLPLASLPDLNVPDKRLIDCFFVVGLPTDIQAVIARIEAIARRTEKFSWNSFSVPLDLLGAAPFIDADTPPASVGSFCVPDGAFFSLQPQAPALFPITLTSARGFLQHVTCLRVSEALDQNVADSILSTLRSLLLQKKSKSYCPPAGTTIYFPKCYCLHSHCGASLTFQREWLRAFYNTVTDSRSAAAMIDELLTAVPKDVEECLDVTISGKKTVPIMADCLEEHSTAVKGLILPGYEVPFAAVMSRMRPAVLVELFCTLMQESQVVLVSSSVTMLTYTSLLLRKILYPFSWCFVFISVCPEGELHIPLMSGQPFIVGVTHKTAEAMASKLQNFVCYDLDLMCLSFPSNRRTATIVMPARLRSQLVNDLTYVVEKTSADNTSVRAPFLRFFLDLLADFPLFLLFLRTADRLHPLMKFEKERFLTAQRLRSFQMNTSSEGSNPSGGSSSTSSGQQREFYLEPFLEAFMKTQCFTNFVDFFAIHEATLFNRLLMSRKGAEMTRKYHIEDFIKVLHSMEEEQLASFPHRSIAIGLPPRADGIVEDGEFGPFEMSAIFEKKRYIVERRPKDIPPPPVSICKEYIAEAADYLTWRNKVIEQGLKEVQARDARYSSCHEVADKFWKEAKGGKVSDKIRAEMLSMAQLEPGRRCFGVCFGDTTGGILLKKEAYTAVVDVFHRALHAAQDQKDIVSPCQMIDLLSRVSYMGVKGEESLSDCTKDEKILQNLRLWDNYFLGKVIQEMRSNSMYGGNSEPLPALLLRRFLDEESPQKDMTLEEMEDKMLFNQIGSVAFLLAKLATPLGKINSFFSSVCELAKVKSQDRKDLQSLAAKLLNMPTVEAPDISGSSAQDSFKEGRSADTWEVLRRIRSRDSGKFQALLQNGTVYHYEDEDGGIVTCMDDGPSAPSPAERIRVSASTRYLSPLLRTKKKDQISDPFIFPMSQLKLRCDDDAKKHHMTVLRGHKAPVLCLDHLGFTHLVSGGCDNSVRIWPVGSSTGSSTRQLLSHPTQPVVPSHFPMMGGVSGGAAVIGRHSGWVNCISVVGAGPKLGATRLLTGSYDHSLCLWDMIAMKSISSPCFYQSPVTQILLQPRSEEINAFSCSSEGKVVMWDMRTERDGLLFESQSGRATCLAWYDGIQFVTGARDGGIRLWDIRQRHVVGKLDAHDGPVTSLLMVPRTDECDLPLIVSGGEDGCLFLTDLVKSKQCFTHAHQGPVNSIAYSNVQRCVASAGADGAVRTWHRRSLHPKLELLGHVGEAIVVRPFRHYFASCGADCTTRIWNPKAAAFTESDDSGEKSQHKTLDFTDANPMDEISREMEKEQLMDVYCRHFFLGHTAPVRAMCTISDSILATAGWDSTIQYTLWK